MILLFTQLYLSCEADVMKHLETLGYSFSCHQTWLQEFDLRVVNLALDLRDGVRLAKLSEVVANTPGAVMRVRKSDRDRDRQRRRGGKTLTLFVFSFCDILLCLACRRFTTAK